MPSFLHPGLLFFLPLAGLPVLIHLINMVRHRRVKWAAMEFLLQSQRRNRTWVLLKQILLLLMRMVAIAAVVLMVSQPKLQNRLSLAFAGGKTHQIVLLDDSYSMSDRWSDTSAFDEALKVVQRLGAQAAQQNTPQEFSLLRFSRAGVNSQGTQPDMVHAPVGAEFETELAAACGALKPSHLDVGLAEAIDGLGSLLDASAAESEARVVYLVSDFRAVQWKEADALRERLLKLNEAGAHVYLVQCVDQARPNLGIVDLKPASATRAVGVALPMQVSVKNFGTQPAREVAVQLEEDGHARAALTIDNIPPNQTASRSFEVKFLTPGQHHTIARLPSDCVAVDNARYAVLDVADHVPVLVIEGDPRSKDAFFVSRALESDPKAPTGIKVTVATARYLGNKPLDPFQAILLLNVPKLDGAEAAALEAYVRSGGGVAFFVGPASQADYYNTRLYRDGQGPFPLPLEAATQLLADRLQRAPDLDISEHPMFQRFGSERNKSIGSVNVTGYFAAKKRWKPEPGSTVKVIARLRNGAPLAIERKFGEGTVLAFLTTAGTSQWNNWGTNISFVPLMLELQAYLGAGRQKEVSRPVGSPIELALDAGRYHPQLSLVMPSGGATGTFPYDAVAAGDQWKAALSETQESGIYEVHLATVDERNETRRFALNVAPEEGDLRLLDGEQLASRLEGVNYDYQRADDLSYVSSELAGFHLGPLLMYSLIGLLLGEQVLAYSASYHSRRASR